MKRLWMIELVTCASFALLLGCGGDGGTGNGGGGGGTFSSGLRGSKMLSGLSADDKQKLCTAASNYVNANPAVMADSCKIGALVVVALDDPKTDAAAQMSCKEATDNCKSSPAKEMMCKEIPSGCKAT